MGNLHYVGIGSRSTPEPIQQLMTAIACSLAKRGYTLRSGGARGADLAFEFGCANKGTKEIFTKEDVTLEAKTLALKYHPAPYALTPSALALHARNGFQILGPNLNDPSGFVVCWTPDGTESVTTIKTGGTGQAIRIAYDLGIPIFNLQRKDAMRRLKAFITKA